MLVLTRRIGEQIVIDLGEQIGIDSVITITVVTIRGDKARIGICAPLSVRVDRSEIHERRRASRPAVARRSVSSASKE